MSQIISRQTKDVTTLNAVKATGAGSSHNVKDYRHKVITASVVGQGAGDVITVKLQGSNQVTAPDFNAAASATNDWTYIEMIDLNDGSPIDGSNGVTWSNSNITRKFAANEDASTWLTLNVTTYTDADTSGSITATLSAKT